MKKTNIKKFPNITLFDLDKVSDEVKQMIESFEKESCVIHLHGEMGAGKTTFTKSLAKKLGISDDVQSPTFTLMREYEIENSRHKKLLHIDAYRFDNKEEGKILGLAKRATENNILIIEWPNNMHPPVHDIEIRIEKSDNQDLRNIYVSTK